MGWGKKIGGAAVAIAGFIGLELAGWGVGRVADAAWTVISGLSSRDIWGCISLAGMAVGAAIAFWPGKKKPVKIPRIKQLSAKAALVAKHIDQARRFSFRSDPQPLDDAFNAGLSLALSFEKEGYPIPDWSGPNGLDEMRHFYFTVARLIYDGHETEALEFAVAQSAK